MTPGKVTTSDNASNADLSLCTEVSPKDEAHTNETKDVKKPIVSFDSDISNSIERNDTKNNDTAPKAKPFDEKLKLETSEEQLLGSLTSMSSPAVRTSARVIQKMKMDSIRPTTPPPVDKDDHHRNAQKTPNQHRPSKPNWSDVELSLFFDGINEYGKDFESIANYINGKQKRKNATDPTYKAKEHVRLLYYQTFQKISKYLRFSEDVARKVQELYAIINYGEMKKKIPVDNQKFFMKLRELVYRGSVTWRVKGKNCRIKTPSCPALRKINQVEKWQEDIKLPTRVDVEIRPADNESWYTVQSLAQNPRVKTSLPLQKRIISLIKTLQHKWKSREAKMRDQTMSGSSPKQHQTASQAPSNVSSTSTGTTTPVSSTSSNALENSTNGESSPGNLQSNYSPYSESILCISPPLDATIHRPYVNLTDFLNSYSICLNSYEKRINASVRGESLCAEHITNVKETIKSNTKRQRHDSGSEKKSPDTKRTKACDGEKFEHEVIKKAMSSTSQDGMSSTTEELADEPTEFSSPTYENPMFEIDDANCHIPESSSADECETEINLWNGVKFKFEQSDDLSAGPDIKKDLIDQRNMNKTTKKAENKSQLGMNKKRDLRTPNRESFRPLINEEVIQKIRKGWTYFNVGDMTIGDLYIMFGQDSKVRLEYRFISPAQQVEIKTEMTKMAHKTEPTAFDGKDIAEDDVKTENVMIGSVSATSTDDIIEAKPFNVDVKPKNPLSNKLKQLLELASLMEKTKRKTSCACGHYCDRGMNKLKKDEVLPRSFISNKTYPSSHTDNTLFRQPVLPTRPNHYEPYRVNASRTKQNRWVKGRNNRVSKQVVVQRILPLQPGITQPFGVLATPDINNYPIDNSMIKPSPSTSAVEYKSTLTEENLSRMNHFSEDANSKMPTRSISNDSSQSSTEIEENSITSEDQKCDSGIETCDMLDSDDNKPEYSTIDVEPVDIDIDSDEEENNRIRQRFNEDPGIQSLMEISLPSPIPITHSVDEFYSDGVDSQPPISPMGILRESPVPSDSKWFEENMSDFSLSSFLGHLEANCDQSNSRRSRSPRCVESSNMSTISETSVDYMTRFEELAESMKNETNNIVTP